MDSNVLNTNIYVVCFRLICYIKLHTVRELLCVIVIKSLDNILSFVYMIHFINNIMRNKFLSLVLY